MKVINEELWQAQSAEFALNITRYPDIEWVARFPRLLVDWAEMAEVEIERGEFGVAECVRRCMEPAEKLHGITLNAKMLANVVVLLTVHWTHGDDLAKELTPIEMRLVQDVTAQQIAELQAQAEQYGQPDEYGRVAGERA